MNFLQVKILVIIYVTATVCNNLNSKQFDMVLGHSANMAQIMERPPNTS